MKNIYKKLQKNSLVIVFCVIAFIGGFTTFNLITQNSLNQENFLNSSKIIKKVSNLKNSKIVKENKISNEQFEDILVSGLFYHIQKKYKDPHSMYFNKDMTKKFNESLNLNVVGIGITSMQNPNGLLVKRVFDNTPAQKAGLKEEDLITGTDEVNFSDLKNEDFVNYIKGNENSKVILKIKRGEENISKTLIRKNIQLPQVTAKNLNSKSLYVNISSFGDNVASELSDILIDNKLETKKELIIDLRGNGGGSLSEVENIISAFVPKNVPILIRKTLNKKEIDLSDSKVSRYPNIKVKILIDKDSASASEILTIALKEIIGAKVYGHTSFGKGSVQKLYNLTDKTSFKFTIEKWFSPSGKGIDQIGITPDFQIDNDKSWYQLPYSKLDENDKVLKKALGE